MEWGPAYRLKGAAADCAALCDSFARSSAPPPEERCQQDSDLLGFVAAATSALECFCFAAYCVGNVTSSARFPMSTAKDLRFYPPKVVSLFKAVFPGDPLSTALETVVNAPEYEQLKVFRDVLSHRGTPPRMHSLSTERDVTATIPTNLKDLAKNWNYDTDLSSMRVTEVWMRTRVCELVKLVDRFTQSH